MRILRNLWSPGEDKALKKNALFYPKRFIELQ